MQAYPILNSQYKLWTKPYIIHAHARFCNISWCVKRKYMLLHYYAYLLGNDFFSWATRKRNLEKAIKPINVQFSISKCYLVKSQYDRTHLQTETYMKNFSQRPMLPHRRGRINHTCTCNKFFTRCVHSKLAILSWKLSIFGNIFQG